jgi:hypothetical protein
VFVEEPLDASRGVPVEHVEILLRTVRFRTTL